MRPSGFMEKFPYFFNKLNLSLQELRLMKREYQLKHFSWVALRR
ncbi:Hypothetical protein Minf_2022 [Methylacidiphilum infernorum V4]|uniref:Uncharacterized protein n=1 Tax=Methylacidiphilum infernorum (isolate V4) TaxID=481448 RepID=B3DYM8_METI4|nr:Hypothetical protein Minf_2022 [Methylacidiphilum infernorum V4]